MIANSAIGGEASESVPPMIRIERRLGRKLRSAEVEELIAANKDGRPREEIRALVDRFATQDPFLGSDPTV